uniref:uncharacterized protein LOC105352131 n=1 Tax=Fragaria vesca subsp. vesca TaxID=101020 RepID=UPI0005CA8B67|nr:PREDICTED: uncharacterized protein LOC105352131 [Fragaria vesca subsp. vesca]
MNKKRKIPPWPKVKELALVSVPPNAAYHAAFIDGILWSCQPMQIRVELSPDYDYSMKLIQEWLMEGGGMSRCCQRTRIKCWRHYIKSVTLGSFIITKDGKKRCYNNENSTMDLTHFEEASDAIFALQWFDHLKS